jgi:hypothetical protein
MGRKTLALAERFSNLEIIVPIIKRGIKVSE